MHIQSGEGRSRGLLCDCEISIFAKVRLQLDSIEGDINELSYSPIVVTVYFVWVGAAAAALLACNQQCLLMMMAFLSGYPPRNHTIFYISFLFNCYERRLLDSIPS